MADRMIVQLLRESDLVEPPRKRRRLRLVASSVVLLIMLLGLGMYIGRRVFPVLPQELTPVQAAQILRMQKGYAGYSLIKTSDDPDKSTLGHAIFCQNCGTEIATVNVNFLTQDSPQPGTRLAILADLARGATAHAAPPARRRREPSPSAPVVAYK